MRLTNFFVIWMPTLWLSYMLNGRAVWITGIFCVVSLVGLLLSDSHLR